MKDGMEYAEMLGSIAVSSCEVTYKPVGKKKRKREAKQQVKEEFLMVEPENEQIGEEIYSYADETLSEDKVVEGSSKRKGFKFDILYAQGLAIFALIVTILLTNIFWENSGINILFKSAFGVIDGEMDQRTYLSFSAKSPSNELSAEVTEGVMTLSGKGALYPVCDGKVSSVVEEDGKYTLTIDHSDKFTTVISGADFVYTEKGAEVYGYIPVCYVADGSVNVCMYDEGNLLTNYIVEDGVIIWES